MASVTHVPTRLPSESHHLRTALLAVLAALLAFGLITGVWELVDSDSGTTTSESSTAIMPELTLAEEVRMASLADLDLSRAGQSTEALSPTGEVGTFTEALTPAEEVRMASLADLDLSRAGQSTEALAPAEEVRMASLADLDLSRAAQSTEALTATS